MSLTFPKLSVNDSLTLRPIAIEDTAGLFAVVDANRAYLREWLPWLDNNLKAENTAGFIQSVIEQSANGSGAVWVIESNGKLCGVVGFNSIDSTSRLCTIGYWLAETHIKQGIMTRSVARIAQYAFEEMNMIRVSIAAAIENQRSRAIPERLNFIIEGEIPQAEWPYDHYVNHVVYVKTRDEWKTQTLM